MSETAPEIRDLASKMLDMLERVEWVRQSGGSRFACAFCSGISERYGGPGHQDDCEWMLVTREGNELRTSGVIR